ncbi:TlpA family protein disulfide reductase [Lutibacter sp. A64]|uniref:TlpA family protein disulfide reductase n=1 Tax=Lutibacter sp. A64 TaxID=2918526 RepID=UPI001F0608AC|nr:TlpA disulfide reductase family protein [Lutibacter sp. A64]UMB53618.1 TlpA family protein disulfide reductase [Lutibacter sp. A64]
MLLVLTSCSEKKPLVTVNNTINIQGKLIDYDQFQGLITYDEYDLLKKTKKNKFDIDSTGYFNFDITVEKPIKATLDFGRVMIKGNGNNRYIYLFLNPGDSIFIDAGMDVISDKDVIKNTLKLKGSGAINSTFVNQEDYTFNSYEQRRNNNYLFIVEKEAADYAKTVDSIKNVKLIYLENYKKTHPISQKLVEIYRDEYENLAIIRKMNYPSSHEGYTKGHIPVLPNDYYDFVKDIKISNNLEEKGLPYLRFVHYYITNKLALEKEKGNDIEFLSFVDQELEGKAKYIYLAYSLGSDFKAEVYNQFGPNCPYTDIAAIVAEKYGHLEKMLPGKPSPILNLFDIKEDTIASVDLFSKKYTYIDLWATWCKPCIAEFPSLNELKEEYKEKNIKFVSISIDKNKQDWVEYVTKHKLEGIQLWVDPENKKIINDGYNITMIPRFVLLDPQGKIVSANAPRPSNSTEVRKIFNIALDKKINNY